MRRGQEAEPVAAAVAKVAPAWPREAYWAWGQAGRRRMPNCRRERKRDRHELRNWRRPPLGESAIWLIAIEPELAGVGGANEQLSAA